MIILSYHPKYNLMANSMAGSNLAIIMELKMFLKSISSDSVKRSNYVYHTHSFTRKRILCFDTLVLFLLHTIKKSLTAELMLFFDHLSFPSCTKQAFSKQRRKLKACFFDDWNRQLAESFYRHYQGQYFRWKGFRLLAVDGSTVALPSTQEIKEAYGCSQNQTSKEVPMARICVLYDVLNQIALQGCLYPWGKSERDSFLPILQAQNLSDSLLLFDRGYPSYWFIWQLLKKDTHFIIRAQSNANKVIQTFIESQKTDIITQLFPSCKSLKKMKSMNMPVSAKDALVVRLVKVVLSSGEIEVLITNLFDNKLFSPKDLKEVYNLRWGIETYYGYIKEELQLGQFSGTSPVCIEQDFAANLFFFNLQSLIEKQCKPTLEAISKKRKYKYKVNKNSSWASLKYRVVELFLQSEPINILKELEILFCRYIEPIRPGRKYPRIKKTVTSIKNYTLTNYKRAI